MGAPYRDSEWLERAYHEETKTQREIAEECDVSARTIRKYMDRFGIEVREISGENHPLYGKERSEETKEKISESLEGRSFRSESLQRMADSHLGNTIPEEVRQKISDSLKGITRGNQTRKKMSESTMGDSNPMWKGGVWSESWYGDTDWLRSRGQVRIRDEFCQVCGHDGSERILDVHHIVPIRLFEEDEYLTANDAHETGNLVLVCRTCHWDAETGNLRIKPDISSISDENTLHYVRLLVDFYAEKLENGRDL
ncbi:MAG: NUMOD3 domain-containing DNA-binding protein [Halobacteriaceae archaeon]